MSDAEDKAEEATLAVESEPVAEEEPTPMYVCKSENDDSSSNCGEASGSKADSNGFLKMESSGGIIEEKNIQDENEMAKEEKEESLMKLKRYCILGNFKPVYIYFHNNINVHIMWPIIKRLVENTVGDAFLKMMRQVIRDIPLARNDEVLFVYAAYLAASVEPSCKADLRKEFPFLISKDEDLFLFCKYASLIKKEQSRCCFSRTVRKAIKKWYEIRPAEVIRSMWLSRRGMHGFTHRNLMKLCHISDANIGESEVASLFFKSCTEIAKADPPEHSSIAVGVAQLRTISEERVALDIVNSFALPYTQVPSNWNSSAVITQQIVGTMPFLEILKRWRSMVKKEFLAHKPFFETCEKALKNTAETGRCSCIYPIHILLAANRMNNSKFKKISETQLEKGRLNFLNDLYLESFEWPTESTELRMHITLNLQTNYKKKYLKNYKTLSYYRACFALAFGYWKRFRGSVDVFYWTEDKLQLQEIHFDDSLSYEANCSSCDSIVNGRNNQLLVAPIVQAMHRDKSYDVFLCIVPTAGRGNPKHNSDFLCATLDEYRAKQKCNARFIIVDLLKYSQPSMSYNQKRCENILEIVGLDDYTTFLINNFAKHYFN